MLTIRSAGLADVSQIATIVNAAFQVERGFRAGDRTSPEQITQLIESSAFQLAVEDGSVVGTVRVRITGSTGYFGMLAVDPSRQRSGIGNALREAAEYYCRDRGCREMTLSTGSVRHELISYYRKSGYTITSIEPAPPEALFTQPIGIVKMAKLL